MNVSWNLMTDPLWIEFIIEPGPISKIEKTYANQTEAKFSLLGSKIFGFPWVDEITIGPNLVKIKRQDWVDWEVLADPLCELIEEHFQHLEGDSIEENPDKPLYVPATKKKEDLSKEEDVLFQFLENEVNPQVAAHGGKINLVKFENGKVFLSMEGGCQGCGMAQVTLREGVETSLKENFDFVKEVVDTTNHSEGINPFIK